MDKIDKAKEKIKAADAVIVGIGAGMSTSAGLTYSGARFDRYFADFKAKYGIKDMYSGGFYPFVDLREYWAWWSRHIFYNRYLPEAGQPYLALFKLLQGRNYFILTTNVDHQIQKAGFSKERLYYLQGDYGLWQCSVPCHNKTYDNEKTVREMVARQINMRVPTELVPYCPRCQKPMTMNLRIDNRFVEDEGWHRAQKRYLNFLNKYQGQKVVFLELGVGGNTPGIIQYPFMQLTRQNKAASYITINLAEPVIPQDISDQTIAIRGDIGEVIEEILNKK